MSDLSERLAGLSPSQRRLLEAKLAKKSAAEPIAIIGVACRFAGAQTLEAYWDLLREGRDAVSEIRPERWDPDEFYDEDPDAQGKMATRWAAQLDDIDKFDPVFFGITPREASRMDPQQRTLLEVAWAALEHGGLPADKIRGSNTGVFIGIGGNDYSKIPTHYENFLEYLDAHVGTGNALSIAANRLSYILDLHGPSMAIDTACSSALVAVDLAVAGLRSRRFDAALAGGVNAIVSPEVTIAFSKARMLSPSGRCRPFDAAADGYVRGEGCGIVVLKRLIDAARDGDHVLAVLRGSAVNQDGLTSGITAPNSRSQDAVVRAALADAGLSPLNVTYIEAHGTGTPLGDPLEVEGLRELFRRHDDEPVCYLGSSKGNVGHTETASGVAGIIKVVLMMQHGWIPPQANFQELNPRVRLEETRLQVPREAVPWTPANGRRIAGVSSYGFGGTNVHVVLEEAAPQPAAASDRRRPLHLLPLSARSEDTLKRLAVRYLEFLDRHPEARLPDICHTAGAGRTHFQHRLAIIASDRGQLRERLEAAIENPRSPGVKTGVRKGSRRLRTAWLFTGQGSQYAGMGRALFDTEPVFQKTLRQCEEILRESLETPLLSVIYPEPGQPSPIDETAYTQPALFSLEYALATLWRSSGIEPDWMLGHSVGEYVAACVAGVFGLEEALWLVAQRGRLMQQLPRNGAMLVVLAPLAKVEEIIEPYRDRVSIAASNGPENTTISGAAEVVLALAERLEADGVETHRLPVSHAFHSPLMAPMLDEFEALASTIEYRKPQVPIASNLTGELLLDESPDAAYWCRHISQGVQFSRGMARLLEREPDVFLEVGPAANLIAMGRRCLPAFHGAWLPSLRKGQDDFHVLFGSLAELYCLGAEVDWAGLDRGWPRRRLALPTYPFEQARYWFEPKDERRSISGGRGPSLHPLLGSRIPSPVEVTLFESSLSQRRPRYLQDHQVQGSVVVPAAVYLEIGLAAAEQTFGQGRHALENVAVQGAMFMTEAASRSVQTVVSRESAGQRDFEVYSRTTRPDAENATWALHACGKLWHGDQLDLGTVLENLDLDEIRSRVIDTKTKEEFYALMASRGLAYGPAFQALKGQERTPNSGLAEFDPAPEVAKELSKYHLHPVLLDACMQAMAGVVPLEPDGSYSPYTYVPVAIRRLVALGDAASARFVYAVRTSPGDGPSPDVVEGDVYLLDDNVRVLVQLSGVRVQRVGRAAHDAQAVDPREWLCRVDWRPQPLPPETGDNGRQPVAREPGGWLILTDRTGVGPRLAERLESLGHRCTLVAAQGPVAATSGPNGQRELPANDPLAGEDYERLLTEMQASDAPPWQGIVHLWSLDIGTAGPDLNALSQVRSLGCGSVLPLVRQLARCSFRKPPGLWLVTRGAQAVGEAPAGEVAVAQSPLWGMGRVVALEHPELRCRLVDLDPAGETRAMLDSLAAELAVETDENQVAYRAGQRSVARLVPAPEAVGGAEDEDARGPKVPADGAFQLRLGDAGRLGALRFDRFQRREVEPDQVEIEICATGLNFSDVLKAMGLYPGITDDIVPLGIECSGVVTAVGARVERFRVGDEVMGVAPYSFASHAISAEYALVHKPANISHDEAATIPITFLTAHYALCHLAGLRRGERVLIHAGAGGVGQAAIQIARHAGAEIFATAGSDEKRDFLRSLGAGHVFNSRTLDFADEIREATGREGVDVVLNSLPGDAITRSLDILRAYGRFLEIGKIDIYQNRMIGLGPFQDNLSYFAIDLDRMLRQRHEDIRRLFAEVMERFESGVYRPLPLKCFPIEEIVDAFRYMAQRKNIGKVVVSLERAPGGTVEEHVEEQSDDSTVSADGTYLITGGLGALGLLLADWLVDQGARYLALLSRRPPGEKAAEVIRALEQKGVRVCAAQADVADRGTLAAALKAIPAAFPPLRGVVHAAGVLDDGALFDMTEERLDRVLRPKVDGAWNLHEAVLGSPLDCFVLFSSVAAVLGSPGQGNYAAGNAFLDALAAYRRAAGLPAVSINWGPWAESGMAAEAGRSGQIEARGIALIQPDQGRRLLGDLLQSRLANVTVADFRWAEFRRALGGRAIPLFTEIAHDAADTDAGARERGVDREFLGRLENTAPETRATLLREYFTNNLAEIIGTDPSELDPEQALNTLGLDSLMAMELKNSLESRLAFSLPLASFLESPTINSLAETAGGLLANERGSKAPGTPAWSPVIPLRAQGAGPPLFCVHPLGGDVRCYFDLAKHLDPHWPLYALTARGTDGVLEPHATMEEMARDYLAAIRSVQPTGPYHLAGWSAGGIYAFAIARVLLGEGDELGQLIFFDTPLPQIYEGVDLGDEARVLYEISNFAARFTGIPLDTSYEELARLDTETAFQTALAEARKKNLVPEELSEDHVRKLCEVCRSNVRVIMDYEVEPMPQEIVVFRPERKNVLPELSGKRLDADLGWEGAIGQAVVLLESPGDHFSMMTGQNAPRLATLLAESLRRAQTERPGLLAAR